MSRNENSVDKITVFAYTVYKRIISFPLTDMRDISGRVVSDPLTDMRDTSGRVVWLPFGSHFSYGGKYDRTLILYNQE